MTDVDKPCCAIHIHTRTLAYTGDEKLVCLVKYRQKKKITEPLKSYCMKMLNYLWLIALDGESGKVLSL